jgi:hypothetical protein
VPSSRYQVSGIRYQVSGRHVARACRGARRGFFARWGVVPGLSDSQFCGVEDRPASTLVRYQVSTPPRRTRRIAPCVTRVTDEALPRASRGRGLRRKPSEACRTREGDKPH